MKSHKKALGVRRETGEEHEVKVLYGEGFAHRTGPEPCAVDREVGGEASAGGGIGQPLSRERFVIPGAERRSKVGRRCGPSQNREDGSGPAWSETLTWGCFRQGEDSLAHE